jgi:hypothetical protein
MDIRRGNTVSGALCKPVGERRMKDCGACKRIIFQGLKRFGEIMALSMGTREWVGKHDISLLDMFCGKDQNGAEGRKCTKY